MTIKALAAPDAGAGVSDGIRVLIAIADVDSAYQSVLPSTEGADRLAVVVNVLGPPAEGLLIRGQQGVDVGDQPQVKLVSTDARREFIDFAT